MAIRNIIQVGDDTLRKKSVEVTDFGEKTHQLLDDMKQTLIKSDGVGLACPQVGVLKRIFIVMYQNKYFECINPVFLSKEGTQKGDEACLSVKGKYGAVERPMKIKLKAFDRYGKAFVVKASGFLAKIFCHEYDHLDGILFIDRAECVKESQN